MTTRDDARRDARDARSGRILAFSATSGFRHTSIPAAVAALARLGERHGFDVLATEDPGFFTTSHLAQYDVVVWVSVTGTVLDDAQRESLRDYVETGGGFVAIHGASAAEPEWPFLETLIGARFASHPAPSEADVVIAPIEDPSTAGLPAVWTQHDEWYRFERSLDEDVEVLAVADHDDERLPVIWRRRVGAGRSWYTALGHFEATYADPLFEAHLFGGLQSASGGSLQ